MGTLPPATKLAGFGCMRLSTERTSDAAAAIAATAVVAAAVEAADQGGLRLLLDTADAYCHDQNDVGHNELLIRDALRAIHHPAAGRTLVATKGGMTRPSGRWLPNGSAKHLRAACAASRAALDVDGIDLYLLHAPDPRVPLGTSVRALAGLRDQGHASAIGLCNVNLSQLRAASAVTRIDAVQVALSTRDDAAIRGGLLGYCEQNEILLIAHSPLGGRRGAAAAFRRAPLERSDNPAADAVAWVRSLNGSIVPIPGSSDPQRAAELVRAQNAG